MKGARKREPIETIQRWSDYWNNRRLAGTKGQKQIILVQMGFMEG